MEFILSRNPPKVGDFPILIQSGQVIGPMKSVEIDNGSALTLSVFGDGALIRTVTPYTTRFNLNTSGGWQVIQILANAAAIATTDAITVVAYDTVVINPLPPSFGVSSWGGGAIPNQLVSVTPGDSILAWQVDQLINALTGVMTGQTYKFVFGTDPNPSLGLFVQEILNLSNTTNRYGLFVGTNWNAGENIIAEFANVDAFTGAVTPRFQILGDGTVLASVNIQIQGPGAQLILFDRDGVGNDVFNLYVNNGVFHFLASAVGSDALSINENGQVIAASNVNTTGTVGGFTFNDRDGVGGDFFSWYANAGLARLFSSVVGGDLFIITETQANIYSTGTSLYAAQGDSHLLSNATFDGTNFNRLNTSNPVWDVISAQNGDQFIVRRAPSGANPVASFTTFLTISNTGRVTAPTTGASAAQLLNTVIFGANPTTFSANGTGSQAITALSLAAAIPASAVEVTLAINTNWNNGGAASDRIVFSSDSPAANRTHSFFRQQAVASGVGGDVVMAIASQQIFYTVFAGGADTWSFSILPVDYKEPS